MIIRRAQHADAPLIIKAHIRSIREVCAPDYTPAQIAAWSGRDFQFSRWCESIDRDYVWVVDRNEEILGFGHLSFPKQDEAYLAGLYFVPEAMGHGLGKKMFELMMNEVRQKQVRSLSLHATITARGFYEAMGFQILEKTHVTMADQKIDCFNMQMLFS